MNSLSAVNTVLEKQVKEYIRSTAWVNDKCIMEPLPHLPGNNTAGKINILLSLRFYTNILLIQPMTYHTQLS
jgi:hypothetical protein